MKWRMGRSAVLTFLCALQIGVFGGIANAQEQKVAITEFALLEKKFDKTGSAEFKPDGTKDGHFQVHVNFPQKTVVNAIVLRSTDVFGKENYHGIWRTNRVGVGWLLGIVQGGKVITPAFRPSPKDPVGTFEGSVTFDLYANDNGDIEEGQYYVLEIETPDDTIYSQPVTFGEPMSGGSTGETPSTPTPNPNPNPSPVPVPDPGQVTDLTVTGGQGTLTVKGAASGAMITLFRTELGSFNRVINYGTKIADSKGNITFAKLQSGDKYYVTESMNGIKSRTSGEATVTDEKTADLFSGHTVVAYITIAQGTAAKQIQLNLQGIVTDSEIKTVAVSYAGVSANVPVDNKGRFYFTKQYDIFSTMDVVTITAEASNGKKHVMHKALGFDLFDDATIKAEKNGNNWVVSANKGIVNNDGFNVYLMAQGNKLVPLTPQADGVIADQTGNVTKYKGMFISEQPIQYIRLLVESGAFVEIVSVLP